MSKNADLDVLFKEWQEAMGVEGKRFVRDGIIHESTFETQSPKILFLGKDPHDKSVEADWDFREEWPKDPKWKHARQIKRWAYGILNGFPDWEVAANPPENTLLKVACMNVKKTGGGSSSTYEDVVHHANTFGDHIRRQVEIISPDIIIGGLRGYDLWSTLYGKPVALQMVEGVGVFRWNDAKVLDFYHPSNQLPHSMQYALLSRIIGSKKFNSI